MKGYSIFPRSSEPLPHHLLQESVISRTSLYLRRGSKSSAGEAVYSNHHQQIIEYIPVPQELVELENWATAANLLARNILHYTGKLEQ